jgi:hypothetical protein
MGYVGTTQERKGPTHRMSLFVFNAYPPLYPAVSVLRKSYLIIKF